MISRLYRNRRLAVHRLWLDEGGDRGDLARMGWTNGIVWTAYPSRHLERDRGDRRAAPRVCNWCRCRIVKKRTGRLIGGWGHYRWYCMRKRCVSDRSDAYKAQAAVAGDFRWHERSSANTRLIDRGLAEPEP